MRKGQQVFLVRMDNSGLYSAQPARVVKVDFGAIYLRIDINVDGEVASVDSLVIDAKPDKVYIKEKAAIAAACYFSTTASQRHLSRASELAAKLTHMK